MKKYIILAAAAIALTACNNEDNFTDEAVCAHISATIGDSSPTRASNQTWSKGDSIGVSMSGRYSNVKYITEDSEGKFDGAAMYFKNKQDEVTISAYYPFSGTEYQTPEVITTSTSADRQTDAEQPKFDFLYAVKDNVTGAQPNVDLIFSHKMSKVTLIFINGNTGTEVSKITSVELKGLYLTGTFNPVTGVCQADTKISASDLILTTKVVNEQAIHPLILFPQNPAKVELNLHDSDGQDYSCELDFGTNGLEAGNNYQFKITVKKTGLSVNPSIVEWHNVILGGEAKSDDSDDDADESGNSDESDD